MPESTIDVDALVAPISDDAPGGEDLEYDPDFEQLRVEAQGKQATQFGGEDEPPNWREVTTLAKGLLGRTKSLEIAYLLARSVVAVRGAYEIGPSLALFARLTVDLWDDVYPKLVDEDGDEDPDYRINAINQLGDRQGLYRDFQQATLVAARAVGSFTIRQYQLAAELIDPVGDEEAPPMELIGGAFSETEPEEVEALRLSFVQAREALEEIQTTANERLNDRTAILLEDLPKLLDALISYVTEQQGGDVETTDDDDEGDADTGGGGGGGRARAPRGVGEIASKDDVNKALENICKYYEKSEPSSPVPLLLRRAQRLVFADFFTIMKDLAPDGTSQAYHIAGIDEPEE